MSFRAFIEHMEFLEGQDHSYDPPFFFTRFVVLVQLSAHDFWRWIDFLRGTIEHDLEKFKT